MFEIRNHKQNPAKQDTNPLEQCRQINDCAAIVNDFRNGLGHCKLELGACYLEFEFYQYMDTGAEISKP
jgi:hypothetical protein